MSEETAPLMSRRAVLWTGASLLTTGVITSRAAAQQKKAAQKLVQYQDKPKGTQDCDDCLHFEPPSSCKMVEGKISPKGWCQLFAPKPKQPKK